MFGWNRRSRILIRTAIISAVSLFTLFTILFYLDNCPCECAYNEGNEQMKGKAWACSFLGNGEAVVGTFVLLCNALLFFYISKQMRQMEEANRIARDAIAMHVMIERGRLILASIVVDAANFTANLTFENVGRSQVIVRSYTDDFFPFMPEPTSPAANLIDHGGIDTFVAPGASFTLTDVVIPPYVGVIAPNQDLLDFRSEIEITYLTQNRKWLYHGGWEYYSNWGRALRNRWDIVEFEKDITGKG